MKTWKIQAPAPFGDVLNMKLETQDIDLLLGAVRAAIQCGETKIIITETERYYRDMREGDGA